VSPHRSSAPFMESVAKPVAPLPEAGTLPQRDRLRVVVIGAGGVGGYFGGILARSGHHVTLLARGEHLRTILSRGLELRTPTAEDTIGTVAVEIVPVRATDDADALPVADLVIVAVKSYSLLDIAPAVQRLALLGGAVLPLLNGVDAADRLAGSGVRRDALLGGTTVISVARAAPGVIVRRSPFQRITLGQLRGGRSRDEQHGTTESPTSMPRIVRIANAFRQAGVETKISAHIEVELWHKLIFLAAMAAACGMARQDVGTVRKAPLGPLLIERAVTEIVAVARANGIPVDPGIAAQSIAAIDALPAAMRPSFLLDLERGGPTELDILSGAVSRLGRELGVPTPIHDTAVATLGFVFGSV
jgi:2-dehydropantoate 2-reductase